MDNRFFGDGLPPRLPRTWNGVIDEVAIFNRALSSNELAAIYAAGSSGMCPPPVGTPVIFVNGRIPSTNVVTATNFALLEIQGGFPDGSIFFTLDGSDPDQGELYTGPLVIADDAIVRTVAYAADFQTSSEADPVTILVAQGPMIHANPQSQTVAAGSPVEFSVAASGQGPLY